MGGVPPTPEWMKTSLSPPGTLQKEFAVFLWAEITFVAGFKKKKVSGQRNAAAVGCGGTDSQEQGGTLFPPVINNKYSWRVQVQ